MKEFTPRFNKEQNAKAVIASGPNRFPRAVWKATMWLGPMDLYNAEKDWHIRVV